MSNAGKSTEEKVTPISLATPVWDRVFTIAPLVVIGTREPDGSYNLAPKHLVTPLSWKNYFGFVCTPQHMTYHNIKREGVFTVSYPRPSQTVFASLTTLPREDDGRKPGLSALPTWPAKQIDGLFVEDAYLFFECELDRIVDGFDINSLIAGRIVAAYVANDSLRQEDWDDNDLLAQAPLLAYLNWGRFARIEESFAFPFMSGFKR
jgi:flavin reductase (DIM6/NTAB) family NADH-FMN oxidoreductase RutF